MIIVDAQVSLWCPDTPQRPCPPGGATLAHRPEPLGKDMLGPALEPVLAVARYPNMAVKASVFPCYKIDPYPFRNLHHHLRRMVEADGASGVFWGTDLTWLRCPYRQAVTFFTEEFDFLSNADKEWVE